MPFPSNGMARWGGGNDNWVGPGSRRTAIRASRSGEPRATGSVAKFGAEVVNFATEPSRSYPHGMAFQSTILFSLSGSDFAQVAVAAGTWLPSCHLFHRGHR